LNYNKDPINKRYQEGLLAYVGPYLGGGV